MLIGRLCRKCIGRAGDYSRRGASAPLDYKKALERRAVKAAAGEAELVP